VAGDLRRAGSLRRQRFTVFNTSNSPGLPSNRLYWLHEDPEGALWIRTESGEVARYHEGVFTAFTLENGLPGPADDFYQDADTLWVFTTGGLARYRDGVMQPYRMDLISESVNSMLRDRRGTLWVATGEGLVRIEPDGTAQRLTTNDGLPGYVTGVYEDRAGTIWVATHTGIARLQDHRFERLRLEAQPWDTETATIHEDASGTLWFGTQEGWWAWHDGRLERFPAIEPGIAGRKLLEEPSGHTWRVQHPWIYRDTVPVLHLTDRGAGNNLRALLLDREGNLWLGGAGLYRIRPRLLHTISEAEGLPGGNVYPILETHDGSVWLGLWANESLVRIQDGVLTTFDVRSLNLQDTPSRHFVTSLFEDRAGTLWVGNLGLLCRIQGTRCVPADLPLPGEFLVGVSAMHEDRQGRFFLGDEEGLTVGVPTPDGRRWTSYPLDHSVVALIETASGDMLLGTLGSGLGRYLQDGQVEFLTTSDGLASDHVRDVYEDREGILWIATQDRGLCQLDRQGRAELRGGLLVCLSTDDGLFDNSLHRILEDDYGRFWMSTNRGIFWVEHAELKAFAAGEVTSVTSVAYTERDGMRNREANGARQPAGIKASDGRLWFPTQDGAVVIDPAAVHSPQAPSVVIEVVMIGEETQRAKRSLVLSADERDIDIGYTALAFSRPEDVRFRYKLDGYDEAWNDVGDRRTATYTNLPPGAYVFRVKAGLGGAWSEEGVTMTIERRPYFWETRWFYGVIALFLAFVGPSIYAYRMRRLERRNLELEQKVAERTAQIREREAQLEQQADDLRRANELKSHFLANISHEFRTPLTLIFGPLDDLLSGRYRSIDETTPLLHNARRNGRRLLRLINQLLDLSRIDAGAFDFCARRYDLVRFLHQRLAVFESLATAQGLSLQFLPDTKPLLHVFDPEKLETIILNLLSNAFKFTPRGGSVIVAVRKNEADEVILTVRDTGIGIPSEHVPHLFDRFYQVDASTTRAREGTGIGLALVKQLVELHRGRITVDSTVGVGSTFTITLPPLAPATDPSGDGEAPAEAALDLAPPEATEMHAAEAVLTDLTAHGRSAPKLASYEAISEDATVVLVVEDNADMRAYLRAHLDGLYHVEEAENGAVGLERAIALVPDLVISDVMMPELDGFGLLAALKADVRTSHVPVVLLTARADAESKIAGLKAGADDYLAKPFHAEELRARVYNLIDGRRRLRERYGQRTPTMHPSAPVLPPVETAFLERVRGVVEARMGETSFGVEGLADEVGMSRRQLYRKLYGLLGEQPGVLIRQMRLERAAALLQEKAGSVKEISYRVGFRSASRFRKAFRAHYGVVPSTYAEQ